MAKPTAKEAMKMAKERGQAQKKKMDQNRARQIGDGINNSIQQRMRKRDKSC